MAVNRLFTDRRQYFDSNGDPLAGGKLFVYLAGSTTKATTYSNAAGSISNTNPLVLDSAGRLQVELYATTGSTYKLTLTTSDDSDPPASPLWTEDNIPVLNDTVTTVDEWTSTGLTPTYVSGTSFTVSGDQTTTLHVGRRLKTTNTSGTIYSSITASSYSDPSTTVTVANDSGTLDAGLSTVYMGLLSSANSSLPRQRDNLFVLVDNSDPTKRLDFQLSGITTATTRTITAPDTDLTLVGTATTQTLTNKTLTSPTINTLVVNTSVSGTAVAGQADLEAASSDQLIVTPASVKYHPGVAKAAAYITYSGATPSLTTSFGVSGISSGGTGVVTINFSTNFSSANYFVAGTAATAGTVVSVTSRAVGSVTVTVTRETAGELAAADRDFTVVVFGDQ